MRTKQCTICEKVKLVTDFPPNEGKRWFRQCNECKDATTRTCNVCRLEKPIEQFWMERGGYRRRTCTSCRGRGHYERHREESQSYMARWYRKQTPQHRADRRAKTNQRRRKLRAEAVAKYGNRCCCCGETQSLFLTFDHVNGGGKEDRALWKNGTYMYYRRLAKEPADFTKYQLLCWNCNSGRQLNGGICPHEDERLKQGVGT